MNKAYSYIRFSTEIQGLGDSYRRQTNLSEDYAKENGLTLVESFEDLGISAFKGKNSENALGVFLESCKNGKIPKDSYLLVESLDRLSRATISNAFEQFLSILRQGIIIVTLIDRQVYTLDSIDNNVGSLFTSLAIMLRAHDESKSKSKRLKAAWKEKRENASKTPISSSCPAWLKIKPDKSGFDVIEKNVELVKRMFELALQGFGGPTISTIFNQEGLKPFTRSKKWFDTSIKHFLTTRTVLGEYQPCQYSENRKLVMDGEPIQNYYPAIISCQDFEKVQVLIGNRQCFTSKGRKGSNYSNLFTSILKCPDCDEPIRYVDKRSKNGSNKNRKPFLQCRSYVTGKTCNPSKWNVEDFENDFFKFVKDFDLNTILDTDNDNQKLKTDLQVLQSNLQSFNTAYHNELKNFETNLELSLNKDLLQGLSNRLEAFKISIRDCELEISEIEGKIHNTEIKTYEEGFADFKSLCNRLTGLSDDERFQTRQKLNNILKGVIKHITIHHGKSVLFGYEIYNEGDDDFIPVKFRNRLVELGYKTLKAQEGFINTAKGQKEWNLFQRYFSVTFKNGKNVYVKPSEGFVMEQEDVYKKLRNRTTQS
jgi:DNA invertase Pin-like site-specific DNA recombinase